MWIYIIVGLLGCVAVLSVGLIVNLTRNKKTVAELRDKIEREKIRQQETERVQKMLGEQQDKTNESYENRLLDWDRLIAEKQAARDKIDKEIGEREEYQKLLALENQDLEQKNSELLIKQTELDKDLKNAEKDLKDIDELKSLTTTKKNNLDKTIAALVEKSKGLDKTRYEKESRIEGLKKDIEKYENRKEELERQAKTFEKDNLDKRKKLEEELAEERKKLEIELSRKREELSSVSEQRLNVVKAQNEIEKNVDAAKKRQEELLKGIAELEKEIEELKEKKRLAVLHQGESAVEGWEFFITPHEKELISLLEKIKMDYAELRGDIATIEWKKIWLPKIQDIVSRNELDGKKCIYRLVLKGNEEVCYVGQAVNVKERWYQHIKKMVGVDTIGNEKLYEYRPDDFLWTIVEENPDNLNESEHYWIEYFGCKEKGLNRKR